jgi:GntR family transcriptional regulator
MLKICINAKSDVPLYQQIVEQLKQLISERQLKPGEQIPAIREMARWLEVNPSTVARAYLDLKMDGVVAASRRRGTIIVGSQDSLLSGPVLNKERMEVGAGPTWGNLNAGNRQEELAAFFALHLSHWRVQRSM